MEISVKNQETVTPSLDQYEIGMRFRYGRGVVADSCEAYKCFEQSAKEGNLEALHRVAMMLFDGVGVAKDPTKGCELLIEAANRGHQESKETLEKIYRYGVGVEKDPLIADMWAAKAAI